MTAHEAKGWINRHPEVIGPGAPKMRRAGVGLYLRPSTPQLRRLLHDRRVPREVRCHVYQWLRYRREESRRRRRAR